MSIQQSELILNPDGSVYHLNLRPENIANTIIFVGDQDRVQKVTQHFDTIEFSTQKREFKTTTGTYKGKRISVISTGIGPDNIDIVLNELDALVNIDLETRQIKPQLQCLDIVRIGTSGSLQSEVPVDRFLMSTKAIDFTGMLHAYQTDSIRNSAIEEAFVTHTQWSPQKPYPMVISAADTWAEKFRSQDMYEGMTATAGGFYGPQGRILRLAIQDPLLNQKIESFSFQDTRITNLEMETAAIYGLSKLLGHRACSLNAIIANRAEGTFSTDPGKVVAELILYALNRIIA